jgi:hypothetical protein
LKIRDGEEWAGGAARGLLTISVQTTAQTLLGGILAFVSMCERLYPRWGWEMGPISTAITDCLHVWGEAADVPYPGPEIQD